MTSPAVSLVLGVTLDRDGDYAPGDEITVTVKASSRSVDTVTVSGTGPDGTTVNSSVDVPVLAPVAGVSFGITAGSGMSFSQEPQADGSVVFRGVIGSTA